MVSYLFFFCFIVCHVSCVAVWVCDFPSYLLFSYFWFTKSVIQNLIICWQHCSCPFIFLTVTSMLLFSKICFFFFYNYLFIYFLLILTHNLFTWLMMAIHDGVTLKQTVNRRWTVKVDLQRERCICANIWGYFPSTVVSVICFICPLCLTCVFSFLHLCIRNCVCVLCLVFSFICIFWYFLRGSGTLPSGSFV